MYNKNERFINKRPLVCITMSNNKEKGLCFRCDDNEAAQITKAADLLNVKPSTFARNAAVSVAEHTIKQLEKKHELDKRIVKKFQKRIEEANKNE